MKRGTLAVAVAGVFATGVAWHAATRPSWNFDALAYAGLARKWNGDSATEAQRKVYADLERVAPAEQVRALREGSPYRRELASDPERFAAQLGLYSNKPFYIALVALAVALGVSSVSATFMVSAVAYGALAFVFARALLLIAKPPLALGLALCAMLLPPIGELGRLATPDAVASLFAFAGLSGLVLARRSRVAAASLIASILARPDSVLLCMAVFGWVFWTAARPRREALVAAGVAVAVCAAVLALTPAPPWSVVFRHTFLERITDPAQLTAPAQVGMSEYASVFVRGLGGEFVLGRSYAPLFIGLTIVSWAIVRRSPDPASLGYLKLAGLLWAAVAAHFALFPMLADRFFAAHYLGIVALSAGLFVRRVGLA